MELSLDGQALGIAPYDLADPYVVSYIGLTPESCCGYCQNNSACLGSAFTYNTGPPFQPYNCLNIVIPDDRAENRDNTTCNSASVFTSHAVYKIPNNASSDSLAVAAYFSNGPCGQWGPLGTVTDGDDVTSAYIYTPPFDIF